MSSWAAIRPYLCTEGRSSAELRSNFIFIGRAQVREAQPFADSAPMRPYHYQVSGPNLPKGGYHCGYLREQA